MMIKAYGKINISLDIVGKRQDGYHLLQMIMQSIDLYDYISIKKNLKDINIGCNKPYVPIDERNLAYKAAKLFINTYDIAGGVDIYIKKFIPVSAGLAGGSTNAAAVLKAMRTLYAVDISDEELIALGLKIGADVPYCIVGGTALCEGIGEVVKPLRPFRNQILVLVKPPFGVSTKEVYNNIDLSKIYKHPKTFDIIKAMEEEDINKVGYNMKNLLENVTLNKHTILKDIKTEMLELGAVGAIMSGSGPTIFGFFNDMPQAQRCYDKFKKKYNDVFITRTI